MRIFKRITDRVQRFFRVDLYMFWVRHTLWIDFPVLKKIWNKLSVVLTALFAGVCFIAVMIGFMYLMAFLNSNKTYEFLNPAEEITGIQVIQVDEEVGLYFHPINDIEGILDDASTVQVTLEDGQITECIEDIYALSASKWWNDPSPYIQDGTFLITYQDGSREWICARGTFYVDKSTSKAKMTWYFFSDEDFRTLLEKYGYHEP